MGWLSGRLVGRDDGIERYSWQKRHGSRLTSAVMTHFRQMLQTRAAPSSRGHGEHHNPGLVWTGASDWPVTDHQAECMKTPEHASVISRVQRTVTLQEQKTRQKQMTPFSVKLIFRQIFVATLRSQIPICKQSSCSDACVQCNARTGSRASMGDGHG